MSQKRLVSLARGTETKDTNLYTVHFPSSQLYVVFDFVLAVFACAIKEVLCFQKPLPLLWQIHVVHIGNCELFSFSNFPQRAQLNPEQQKDEHVKVNI